VVAVPITTSWRAPLEPSMMVTILCWPGTAPLGAAPVSSLDEAVVVALSNIGDHRQAEHKG